MVPVDRDVAGGGARRPTRRARLPVESAHARATTSHVRGLQVERAHVATWRDHGARGARRGPRVVRNDHTYARFFITFEFDRFFE